MEKLLHSAGLTDVTGTSKFHFSFSDELTKMTMSCEFSDVGMEIDLFDMIASLARGLPEPQGNDANSIDLDIDVGFDLKRIGLEIESNKKDGLTTNHFNMTLGIGLSFGGMYGDITFNLSNEILSLEFDEIGIPISIPHLPLHVDDLRELNNTGGHWDYRNKWVLGKEEALNNSIKKSNQKIKNYKQQIEKLEKEIATLLSGEARDVKQAQLKDLTNRILPQANKEGFDVTARKFMIESILAIYNLLSNENSKYLYQEYVEQYQEIMDATIGAIHVDTNLLFVLTGVKFILPFNNPSDIRVEGGARIEGFADDDPMKPLEDLQFKLGLSAENIFFSVSGGGDPIPFPEFGRYKDGSINLKHLRIGYGYSKNSFSLAFAGELRLPKQLVEDADTSNTTGVGIRLPVHSKLDFKLDLIPIVLGEVDFILPLIEFDIDLRQPDSPALVSTQGCKPNWDGLQLVVPDKFRFGFKRARFAPFFGPLPAVNFRTSYDMTLGNEIAGMNVVCDDYLVINPVLGQYPVPLIADAIPFFNNLCTHIRFAGFEVNINLQRPFPSMSPLAFFEILGLLSDPKMKIDPEGDLASTIRVTIQDASIKLPPAVIRLFPEYNQVISQTVNYTINLGSFISIAQDLTGYVENIAEFISKNGATSSSVLNFMQSNPPTSSPDAVFQLLPPEMRRFELEGSFMGFCASVVLLLLSTEEAKKEITRRDLKAISKKTKTNWLKNNEKADAKVLKSFKPNFTSQIKPIYFPDDPENNLFNHELFQDFTSSDVESIPFLKTKSAGVILGARVKILDHQIVNFLGAIFTDGSFHLLTTAKIHPLRLSVAGIPIELPLEINGRLELSGIAKGADSNARISAKGWSIWNIIPDILSIEVGEQNQPVSIDFHSNGQFSGTCSARIILFNEAAEINGTVDISNHNCIVLGELKYSSTYKQGDHPFLSFTLNNEGALGPGTNFSLSGSGTLRILGKKLLDNKSLITQNGIAIEGQFEAASWKVFGYTIGHMSMRCAGLIDLRSTSAGFRLEGEGFFKIFGAIINGKFGIKAFLDSFSIYGEGKIQWQGQEWLGGRIEMGSEGLSLEGKTSLALDLPNIPSNLKSKISLLFLTLDITGKFKLNSNGRPTKCELNVHWTLGMELPGAKGQRLPIAMQALNIDFSNPGNTSSLVTIQDLISIDKLSLLPVDNITLPTPQLTPKKTKSLYLTFESKNLNATVVAPKIVWRKDPEADYVIPYGWDFEGTKKINIIKEIRKGYNELIKGLIKLKLPFPPLPLPEPDPKAKVEITVPQLGTKLGIGVIGDYTHNISVDSFKVPNLTTERLKGSQFLLEIPTDFDVNFEKTSLNTVIEKLGFTVSLGWKGKELGIIVSQGDTKEFTPFNPNSK